MSLGCLCPIFSQKLPDQALAHAHLSTEQEVGDDVLLDKQVYQKYFLSATSHCEKDTSIIKVPFSHNTFRILVLLCYMFFPNNDSIQRPT